MLYDRQLAAMYRRRIAIDDGVDILIDAWQNKPTDDRAAMLVARGDAQRAGAYAGGAWKDLTEKKWAEALETVRQIRPRTAASYVLEAEILFSVGAIAAGFDLLESLHRSGDAAASLLLTRRCHILGDHEGAQRVAETMPMNAHAALVGARSALANEQTGAAIEFILPFFNTFASIPESNVAGGMAMVMATVLARRKAYDRLHHFANYLLNAGDMPEDMMPATARICWTAGLALKAWQRFDGTQSPWMAVARLELAMLAGNVALAMQMVEKAGPLGAPAKVSLSLLSGGQTGPLKPDTEKMFSADMVVHIWRSHAYRWQPWIDAALQFPANVSVFDLRTGQLPAAGEALPHVVLDDGSLSNIIPPQPVALQVNDGLGVWVDKSLCDGIGIGHDWLQEETEVIKQNIPLADSFESAAISVLGSESALKLAHTGRPMIVIAPPGDPFWGGALPERAWPAMRILRADPIKGWNNGGTRIVEFLRSMLE